MPEDLIFLDYLNYQTISDLRDKWLENPARDLEDEEELDFE